MSSQPKLVLDTNALRDADFMMWLASEYHGDITVSPIAYAEIRRQLLAKGKEPDKLDRMMSKAHVTVDTFGKKEAIAAAEFMSERTVICPTCRRIDWADTMVYASIGNPPTLLVTNNVRDFPDSDRVRTTNEIKRMFSMRR